jgi:hypothetical protein
LPEENAWYSGELTERIGRLDERHGHPERPQNLKDTDFTPQVSAVRQFQERDEAVPPDAEDLVAGEGRHFGDIGDGGTNEPARKAAGVGSGEFPGDG